MNVDFSIYTDEIRKVINEWEQKLLLLPEKGITEKRNHQNRTIKQLLGHLIDSASNNHQRIIRLQYNDHLIFPDYTQDNDRWIAIQDYQHADWENLVQLWKYFNLHIIHLIETVDQSKLNNYWTDFEGRKVTLEEMIKGYSSHLNLHMSDINDLILK
ncbi:MAG: DinB family protein [Bacteroidales bacterium]|jgi:hypothetical protein|nr:DinB family protein [Bacteroidales bacterium]